MLEPQLKFKSSREVICPEPLPSAKPSVVMGIYRPSVSRQRSERSRGPGARWCRLVAVWRLGVGMVWREIGLTVG
jgi:hypothetical protein